MSVVRTMTAHPMIEIFPRSEAELEDVLSAPNAATVKAVQAIGGDITILGTGGKMGPSLAKLAQRSIQAAGLPYRVRCISRFGAQSQSTAQSLKAAGIDVISADLLEPGALDHLPDADNVIFLVGMKFGSTGAEALTWATNTLVPGLVARRYAAARIVALSSGNVYPFSAVTRGGPDEHSLLGPVGDYAQSCVGRERMFEYGALTAGTRVALLRLNYANDLRYGVIHDLARKVFDGEAIDLNTGSVNVIWQGDANRVILQAFGVCASPARVLNLTGPETVSVRWLAEVFGRRFNRTPILRGEEASTALLSNATECHRLFGYPQVTLGQMIDWTAHWIESGGRSLSKPTHFETRDGKF